MPSWWVADALEHRGPAFLASWVVWVIVSITLHELAHGWAALRQGDQTPRLSGHMTWNPLVHMGPHSLIVFALIGIAWGAMPVDPTRFRHRYGDFVVSLAGPLMNVSLALTSIVLGGVWLSYCMAYEKVDAFYENVGEFFYLGASLNVMLAILNLLPIPPLDGSHMLANVSRSFRALTLHPQAPMAGMMALVAVFVFGGEYLWMAGDGVAGFGTVAVALLLPFGAPAEAGL